MGKNIKSLEEKSHSSLISSEVSELSLRRKVRKERALPRARGAEAIDSGKEVPDGAESTSLCLIDPADTAVRLLSRARAERLRTRQQEHLCPHAAQAPAGSGVLPRRPGRVCAGTPPRLRQFEKPKLFRPFLDKASERFCKITSTAKH